MRRSTIVAVVAVVWMGTVLLADVLDGAFSGFALFAAFVVLVGFWEISKEVRMRRAG